MTLGVSCYYLYLFFGKYYSPLSDFFAFKEIAEGIFNFHLEFSSKRLPTYPFLLGLFAQIIPAKKAALYSGIFISNVSYLGSIFLIHKISQRVGIKNPFLVSWFFAFSTLSLYCAIQPLPEALILFLILLSLYVQSEKLSLGVAGIATFTRFDGALAIFANLPKIIIKKKKLLISLFCLILLLSLVFLGVYYIKFGKSGYIYQILEKRPFVIDKPMGNFASLLRTFSLFYLPDDHYATVSPETRFHASWWVQLLWLLNLFFISVGIFHLLKLNKANHWKIITFFLLYFLFLWFYIRTDWRKMYFLTWFFPLYTIAGIEYFLSKRRKKKKFFIASLVIVVALVIYGVMSTPYLKTLYSEFFKLRFDLSNLSRFLIFIPICTYVLLKVRQTRSTKHMILIPLFLAILPLTLTHISAINNLNGNLWDLRAGMEEVKSILKEDDIILMPEKMVDCATYISDIPEKNVITYFDEDFCVEQIRFIASYSSWYDPVIRQIAHGGKTITIKNRELSVREFYRLGIFRLFEVDNKI